MIEIGNTVRFEMDPGKFREGVVTNIHHNPGWSFSALTIKYRNSFFSRLDQEVEKV